MLDSRALSNAAHPITTPAAAANGARLLVSQTAARTAYCSHRGVIFSSPAEGTAIETSPPRVYNFRQGPRPVVHPRRSSARSMTTQPLQLRWWQIRLKTLLIAMAICCVGFGVFANWIESAREQRAAELAWDALDMQVQYDYHYEPDPTSLGGFSYLAWSRRPEPPGPAWLTRHFGRDMTANIVAIFPTTGCGANYEPEEDLYFFPDRYPARDHQRAPVWNEQMARLSGLRRLRILDASGGPIDDDGVANLAGLTDLTHLNLGRTEITDQGFLQMGRLRNVEFLDVHDTRITDASLGVIAGMKPLRILSLAFTCITDTGIKHLENLAHLEQLQLSETAITDASLPSIAKLTRLTRLDLNRTNIAGPGLAALSTLKELEELDLRIAGLASEHLLWVASLPRLRKLSLDAESVDELLIEALVKGTKLETLTVHTTSQNQFERVESWGKKLAPHVAVGLAEVYKPFDDTPEPSFTGDLDDTFADGAEEGPSSSAYNDDLFDPPTSPGF